MSDLVLGVGVGTSGLAVDKTERLAAFAASTMPAAS
jgi:hypothetical protein